MARHARFAEVSPEVGELNEDAFAGAMSGDEDAALTLLADMAIATDERLRAAARRLAAKIVLDVSRRGSPTSRGIGKLRLGQAETGGDLDVDASIDAIVAGRAAHRPPELDELFTRHWGRPALALCLIIDRSGSMGGERLAAAALAASACAWRAPGDHSIITFAREVQVLREMGSSEPAVTVVDAILGLRGHGTTSLSAALHAASAQLERTNAHRRVAILLSDCRSTDEVDPAVVGRLLPELMVLAPAGDCDEAVAFAVRAGARCAPLLGVADAPAALASLLA